LRLTKKYYGAKIISQQVLERDLLNDMLKRVVILGLFCFLLVGATHAARTWEAQVSTSEGILNDVKFFENGWGWVVGDGGVILRSLDFGKNWTSEASGTAENLYSLYMLSTNEAWAAGSNRTIVKYNGTSWSPSQISSSANFDLTRICASDTNKIWVTAGTSFLGALSDYRNLFYSNDGGTTWNGALIRNSAEAETILNYFYSVYFSDANHGWLVGVNSDAVPMGKVFKTTDGGVTWIDVSPSGAGNITFRDVYFADENYGWVVGGDENSKTAYVYYTSDGGSTWSVQYTFNPALFRRIVGTDNGTLWVADRANTFRFEKGTWAEDSAPLSQGYFNSVYFIDAWNGWAVGGLLSAEGGPLRYIYKYSVDPYDLVATPNVFLISNVTYEATFGVFGGAIQADAVLTLEAVPGLSLVTYEVVYDNILKSYKLNARATVEPTAVAGTYSFTVTNPREGRSGTGTITLKVNPLVNPTVKPTAQPMPAKVFDPATEDSVKIQVNTTGQAGASGVRASSVDSNVELELIVYRPENRQIAYRKKFFADPKGYTTITLKKVTDLGLDISEGVYNAIVLHPQFGKIGSGVLVVHYSK